LVVSYPIAGSDGLYHDEGNKMRAECRKWKNT
jgi:hypothetical protein